MNNRCTPSSHSADACRCLYNLIESMYIWYLNISSHMSKCSQFLCINVFSCIYIWSCWDGLVLWLHIDFSVPIKLNSLIRRQYNLQSINTNFSVCVCVHGTLYCIQLNEIACNVLSSYIRINHCGYKSILAFIIIIDRFTSFSPCMGCICVHFVDACCSLPSSTSLWHTK